jgi:hypothetical protein
MRARLLSGCAVLLVAATGHGIGAHGQVQGVPGHVSWTVASREVSKYEGLYGETLFVSLELLVGPLAREADVPARRTIRTSGLFYASRSTRRAGGRRPTASRSRDARRLVAGSCT